MFKSIGYSVCATFCLWSSLAAQDTPPAQFEQRAAVIVQANTDDNGQQSQTIEMVTSDGGNFLTFSSEGGGMPFMLGGGDPMQASEMLLNNPSVQKELELVDSQREQIQQMKQEFGKEIKSKIDEIMKAPNSDKGKIGEAMHEIEKRKKDRLAEILLPHQIDRLKQVSFQASVNQGGMSQALLSKSVMEQLGIDEKQKDELAKKAEELTKEFDGKVAKLKADLRDELVNELKPEQREKMKQLMGSNFEFENQSGPTMLGPGMRRSSSRSAKPDNGNN